MAHISAHNNLLFDLKHGHPTRFEKSGELYNTRHLQRILRIPKTVQSNLFSSLCRAAFCFIPCYFVTTNESRHTFSRPSTHRCYINYPTIPTSSPFGKLQGNTQKTPVCLYVCAHANKKVLMWTYGRVTKQQPERSKKPHTPKHTCKGHVQPTSILTPWGPLHGQ